MVKELSGTPMVHIPFANGILDEKTVKVGFGLSIANPMMVIDILSYRLFFLKKVDIKIVNLIDHFKSKILPSIPISAEILMKKYNIPAGKNLGDKLKALEEEWIKNDFRLSDKQIDKIISL